ncbi:cornifelin-like [Polymixia lowei]
MMANTIIVQPQQQKAEPAFIGWTTDLLDCCDDMNSCCYGFWCCPCLACTTTGKFGDNTCLPLLDICTPAITAACGLPLCVPPAGLSLRVAIRHKYGIKGSLCHDIMTACFCEWCSWCQMARELKYRKKKPEVVSVQPVVVNVQSPTAAAAPQIHMVNQQTFLPPAPSYGPQFTGPTMVAGPSMVPGPPMVTAPGYGPTHYPEPIKAPGYGF